MYSVILCGGSGTRLWPLSRKNFPKQFLKLYSDKSLLQETFLRMREIIPVENIFFVTSKDNFFHVINQIKEVESNFDRNNVLTEPASLNTAPAITYAIKYLTDIKKISHDEPIIIVPSDHYISEKNIFFDVIKKAAISIGDNIGTIGITPISPETGYGYIKKGSSLSSGFTVDEFKEKPSREIAEAYLKSGEYVWNSGIYIFSIRGFVQELQKHAPEIYSIFIEPANIFINKFASMPSVSIDIAISEKSNKVVVFEGDFGWNDIGSFDSLADILQGKDNLKHININSNNNFVYTSSNKLVVTSDVDDLIVIENNDSILIQKRGKSENIKKVVEHLVNNQCKETEHNLIVHRPWGKYEVLIENKNHKVKKITVNPGEILSLQSHYHRAEHWVVVHGVAKIVNGDKEIILRENESTFIPALAKHRLENPGKNSLEIIEVQTGNYLEEDDIVRYDDKYNRS